MSVDKQPRPTDPASDGQRNAAGRADAAADEKRQRAERDVGAALRTVYQKTVDEKVPDEFLDLLGKLG